MPGNSFGQLFRITTFGESHGGAVGVVVDGCPPNLEISEAEIQAELDIIYASVRWQILQVIYKTLIIIFRREQFRRKIGKKQKIFTADISDIRILQKYNKELVQEIGTIYASGGWRFFERLKKFRK